MTNYTPQHTPQQKNIEYEGNFEALKEELANSPSLQAFFLGIDLSKKGKVEEIMRSISGDPQKQREFARAVQAWVKEKDKDKGKEPQLPDIPEPTNTKEHEKRGNQINNYFSIKIEGDINTNIGSRDTISNQKRHYSSRELPIMDIPTVVILLVLALIFAFFTSPLVAPSNRDREETIHHDGR